MRAILLAVLVMVGGCHVPTAPEPDDDRIDWPVREWRDTVVVYDPETGANLP